MDGTSEESVHMREYSYGSYEDMVARPVRDGVKIYRRVFVYRKKGIQVS